MRMEESNAQATTTNTSAADDESTEMAVEVKQESDSVVVSTTKQQDDNTDIKKENEEDPASTATSRTTSTSSDKAETEEEAAAKKKKQLEDAEKYKDWPLREVTDPHDHDVLYGRGGGTNHHPGNKRYRKMVEDRKVDYVNSKRLDKPLVALEIIREWRAQLPPGRFLKLDERTGMWNDVGDKKAREKTSQALREKAPLIRKQQEEEKRGTDCSTDSGDENGDKVTRFAEGTNTDNKVGKPVLARDHSLGREYLQGDEPIGLEGFSWQEPFKSTNSVSGNSHNSDPIPLNPPTHAPQQSMPVQTPPPPPPPQVSSVYHHSGAHSRNSSGHHYPYPPPSPSIPHTSSYGYPYPPHGPPPEHYHHPHHMRYDSWSSVPPPPMPGGYMSHHGSGMSHGSGVWRHDSREHSLGQFPLPHANIMHPAAPYAFDSRNNSGAWGPRMYSAGPPPPHGPMDPSYPYPPPPPPQQPAPAVHQPSAPYIAHSNSDYSDHSSNHVHGDAVSRSPRMAPPSPKFSVDIDVASVWSGQDKNVIVMSMSSEEPELSSSVKSSTKKSYPSAPISPHHFKPDIVKRSTSNQNETYETRPDLHGTSVKRAALNRDSSRASNRLKEICFPDKFNNGKFDAAKEMQELSEDMHRSSLRTMPKPFSRESTLDLLPPIEDLDSAPKPRRLTEHERMTTVDMIAMELMIKPIKLNADNRMSTIDALAIDGLSDDVFARSPLGNRGSTIGSLFSDFSSDDNMLSRPGVLTMNNRITTTDILDIVNEPLADD